MINCNAAFKWNIFNVQFLLQKSCTSILFWQWSRTLGKGSDRGFLRSAKSRVIFFECMDKANPFPVPHLQLKKSPKRTATETPYILDIHKISVIVIMYEVSLVWFDHFSTEIWGKIMVTCTAWLKPILMNITD